jgi:hypothetical protein
MSSTVGSLVGHAHGSGQLLGMHTLQIPSDSSAYGVPSVCSDWYVGQAGSLCVLHSGQSSRTCSVVWSASWHAHLADSIGFIRLRCALSLQDDGGCLFSSRVSRQWSPLQPTRRFLDFTALKNISTANVIYKSDLSVTLMTLIVYTRD